MAKLPKTKECPSQCPKCSDGDLSGGGPLACRYTCGHVVPKADLPTKNKALIEAIGKGE